jgi:SPP1 family predicted phage head-tail adaptor
MIKLGFVKRLGGLVKDIREPVQYYNMQIGQKKGRDVNSSTMTRRVGVYVPTKTSDGQGGYSTSYALQETVWGDFRPAKSTRTLLEQELTFYQDARVFIRYGITIADYYRLDIDGNTYTIQSINDVDNAHRFLEIILNG